MCPSERQKLSKKITDALKVEEFLFLDTVEWYANFGINEDDVRLLLRSQIHYIRFYPRRQPKDAYINNFEPNIHGEFINANMDIQVAGSSGKTLKYLLKYQLKGEPTRDLEAKEEYRSPSLSNEPEKAITLSVRIFFFYNNVSSSISVGSL